MEIDESSKTIESTTPNMRNIFSNPQLNSTTERSASTEKPKTDSSQDKITAFIGLILFNVVTALIYMITRIIGRNIYTTCTDLHDGDCVNGSCDKVCNPISRIRKRLPYIYWFNVIDIAVIVCSLATEYLVLKYSVADWIIILLAFITLGIAIAFGLKNIVEKR